ncbi:MAG: hypothetical protein GF353_22675 [Candidatus Lokiarchaeota archaeon]|nr:hypothetical protein [Candidatus Lokiarchaeota archaeon]
MTGFDSNLYQDYALVWKIGFLATTLGLLSIIFISEIAILKKKSRFLISIFYLLSVILVLIPQDIQTVQIISIIPSAIAMIYIPLSYLYLARYKAIRKRALSIFAGFFIFFAGTAIHTEDLVQIFISIYPSQAIDVRSIFHIISICMKLLGIGFLVYGYGKKTNQ